VSLLLEDTSELSWSGGASIEGLGPIGEGSEGLQGFLLHSVLAVGWPEGAARASARPPLPLWGLADQQYHVRIPRPENEPNEASLKRKSRWREAQLWGQASQRLGPAPSSVRWVRVCDRGADIYEFLRSCQAHGHGFVVRAAQDRSVLDPVTGVVQGRLFNRARAAEGLGEFTLQLRARASQGARRARLRVSAARVHLQSPQRPGRRRGSQPPIACTVVRVFEANPPPQVATPLEWVLLCDREVASFEAALECALQYAARWLVEEFHKVLKTGLGAERLQLEQADRLFAAIALMSVVALRVLDLRERLRHDPMASTTNAGLTELELRVLQAASGRPLQTVRDVGLALSGLGGFLARKADGLPGWLTLYRGMKELNTLVSGVQLAQHLQRYG
jgi:hypothetical protein